MTPPPNPEDEQAVSITLRRAEVTALLAAGNYVYTNTPVENFRLGARIGWLGAALSSIEGQLEPIAPEGEGT